MLSYTSAIPTPNTKAFLGILLLFGYGRHLFAAFRRLLHRRVSLTRGNGQVQLWRSIGVVRRVQRSVESSKAMTLVHVSGYVKRDGTVVQPLERAMPNNSNQKWRATSLPS